MTHSQENPFQAVFEKQKRFFASGATRSIEFRIEQIRKLEDALQNKEDEIFDALQKDFQKSPIPSYTGELGLLFEECRIARKNLSSWMRPQKVSAPKFLPFTRSFFVREPYGTLLIISPFNVPFVGPLLPLIGSIAAGNCSVLKISDQAKASEKIVEDIIRSTFSEEFVAVVTGSRVETEALLELPFGHFFFMGGTETGRAVLAAATKHLAPATLELGGKCPAIVDANTSLETAARRIIWGRFFNAGQECVSIDHVYVPTETKETFVELLKKYIVEFFGKNPKESPDYERIVSERHFDRIVRFLGEGRVLFGGETDREERYIAPTLIDSLPENSLALQEEIFGPILPIIEYDSLDSVLSDIQNRPKPLAVYIFSHDRAFQKNIIEGTQSGSVCINDSQIQNVLSALPIGGIGQSGFGRIHGRFTFEAFSQTRSIVKQIFSFDPPGRFPPYNEKFLFFIKKLLG